MLRCMVMAPFRSLAAWCLALAACSSDDRAAGISERPVGFDGGNDGPMVFDAPGGEHAPPPPDAEGYCGNEFFQVVQEPPNLYFVIDRSGSMNESVEPPSSTTRYSAVRAACVHVVRQIGSRANFGAAVFPGSPYADECSTGIEVFPTRPGDPPGTPNGPVANAFAAATNVEPLGGTPIAATLAYVLPIVSSLTGKTAIVLATDGGPNCNPAVACGIQDCIWNIEHEQILGMACDETYNCCDQANTDSGNLGCLDAAATIAAVQALRDAGIRTYVVGIPGSGPYADLLDQLAIIGGSARPDSPRYYRVDDISTLQDTLSQIGDKALVTCQFQLSQPPPDPDFVNVYLDATLLPYDEMNGWSWIDDTRIQLNGEACAKLERGEAAQVQVVAGCPTQQPR